MPAGPCRAGRPRRRGEGGGGGDLAGLGRGELAGGQCPFGGGEGGDLLGGGQVLDRAGVGLAGGAGQPGGPVPVRAVAAGDRRVDPPGQAQPLTCREAFDAGELLDPRGGDLRAEAVRVEVLAEPAQVLLDEGEESEHEFEGTSVRDVLQGFRPDFLPFHAPCRRGHGRCRQAASPRSSSPPRGRLRRPAFDLARALQAGDTDLCRRLRAASRGVGRLHRHRPLPPSPTSRSASAGPTAAQRWAATSPRAVSPSAAAQNLISISVSGASTRSSPPGSSTEAPVPASTPRAPATSWTWVP